jgi:membrane-associated HD superfamily phosphohydrolase
MKKWFIYASVAGLAVGVIYWLCKKGKTNTATSQTVDKQVNFENDTQEENSQNTSVVEEMYQAKSESVQAVYERHSEAGSIMKDAYSNIMENFVEDFSSENDANAKDENKKVIIDSESVSVMKEIDSISDELDDLLK